MNSSDLKESREDVCRLTSDDEQAGVEFAQTCIQVLQTMQQKPEEPEGRMTGSEMTGNAIRNISAPETKEAGEEARGTDWRVCCSETPQTPLGPAVKPQSQHPDGF